MRTSPPPATLVARVRARAAAGGRHIVGLAGPPGAGKSTLAELVVSQLAPLAVLVPLDGFHLAGAELRRLGSQGRKDTFDVDGYVALLGRLRERGDEVVYAPEFRREIEEAVAGAIPVPREVPVVITEGNYLLLDDGPWARVRPLLDETWYLEADEVARLEVLVARHVRFGRSPAAALDWAHGSDQRNARTVAATRHLADIVVRHSYSS